MTLKVISGAGDQMYDGWIDTQREDLDLLEYCDDEGRFHYTEWSFERGKIYRSLFSDHRNKDGAIGFASLIVDARKPK